MHPHIILIKKREHTQGHIIPIKEGKATQIHMAHYHRENVQLFSHSQFLITHL
jgi:hypothetical protein